MQENWLSHAFLFYNFTKVCYRYITHHTSFIKGRGHGKITADFFGQIYSLSSVKTENVIFKIFGIH